MKTSRNESEDRFYQILRKAGFESQEIKEPDLDSSVIGTADFLVGDVVFEVKEIIPSKEEQEKIDDAKKDLSEKKAAAWMAPDVTRQFKNDIESARRKFKKYANCATVLVEDCTGWWRMRPDLETLLFGVEQLHIDMRTGTLVGNSWSSRQLQIGKNKSIGTYMFIFDANQLVIHHNLMADEYKMMPIEYMRKFQAVSDAQYIFINLPGGPPHYRQLM